MLCRNNDLIFRFTELALVTHKPRAASAYAVGATKTAGNYGNCIVKIRTTIFLHLALYILHVAQPFVNKLGLQKSFEIRDNIE